MPQPSRSAVSGISAQKEVQLPGICRAEALAGIGEISGPVDEDRIGRLVTALNGSTGAA